VDILHNKDTVNRTMPAHGKEVQAMIDNTRAKCKMKNKVYFNPRVKTVVEGQK
jgi:hypothetical protein